MKIRIIVMLFIGIMSAPIGLCSQQRRRDSTIRIQDNRPTTYVKKRVYRSSPTWYPYYGYPFYPYYSYPWGSPYYGPGYYGPGFGFYVGF